MRERISEGLITFEQLEMLSEQGCQIICHRTVQSIAEPLQNRKFISRIIQLSREEVQTVMKGYTWKELHSLFIQTIDDTITSDQLSQITDEAVLLFRNKETRLWLEQEPNQQYIPRAIRLSAWAAKALNNSWVRSRISDGSLTFKQLETISEGGLFAISNLSIQAFVNYQQNKQQFFSKLMQLSREDAIALLKGRGFERLKDLLVKT